MAEIVRNLARRKLRSTLTISGIVIGIFALTTMGAMAEHFNALIGGGVTYYASNVQVGADNATFGSMLPISKVDQVSRVSGVVAAFPGVEVSAKPGNVKAVSFGVPDYIASEAPGENQYSAFKVRYRAGRPVTDASRGEVALGSSFAGEFNKKVGDTIALPIKSKDDKPGFVQHTFTVVGLLDVTNTAPDSGAYVSLADAQMLLKDQLPPAVRDQVDTLQVVTGITVYGTKGEDLDQLADRINAQVTGVKAQKPSSLVASFKSGGAIFTAITTGAALLALVIGGLSVVNTMIMAVTERIREIGLKKALGAHTGQVMREYLAEATVIGALGGLIGFGLGALLTIVINAASSANLQLFLITPNLAILALGFAVALGALAGVVPALRAARLDPVTALRTQS